MELQINHLKRTSIGDSMLKQSRTKVVYSITIKPWGNVSVALLDEPVITIAI